MEIEEALHKKAKATASSRVDCEVATMDPYVCVYRTGSNITFYVLGASEEVRLLAGSPTVAVRLWGPPHPSSLPTTFV